MKGGSIVKSVLITVGNPTTTFTISGVLTDGGGAPVRDVRVSNGLTGTLMRWAYTDSDGAYTITNLATGSVTLSALKGGYAFTPGFSNPVTVGPNQTAKNFTAAAGTFVSIEAVDASANESGDTGLFRITRTGDTSAALTVYTDFSGVALFTSDYTRTPVAGTTPSPLENFTIPAGSATLDVTITGVTDALQEGPETVVMSLVNGGSYLPTGPQTATVTIADANSTKPRVNIVATGPEATGKRDGGGAIHGFTRGQHGSGFERHARAGHHRRQQ